MTEKLILCLVSDGTLRRGIDHILPNSAIFLPEDLSGAVR
jgi:hypothetical protein